VKFNQLRLTGFKSFVDPAELRIEEGLTGVIGPNGCGKSNLLEALRWVMGATSAKSLRGGGMDDVIFAGTDSRAGRDRAEVTLSIDNTERSAGGRFNEADELEIRRRIVRGHGSTYFVNGEEVRAKDVQLLFADAGTGANSPALVRQGQISELIAAKPENRRRVLEEAAGVAGLRARRREAQLRLAAAETNLDRVQEVIDGLDGRLSNLQRQARQAVKYREISATIRDYEGLAWTRRWRDAAASVTEAERKEGEAEAAVRAAVGAAAGATATAEKAQAAVEPLRLVEAEAGAALRLVENERDQLDRDIAAAGQEIERLEARLKELGVSRAREIELSEEAGERADSIGQTLERLRDGARGDETAIERAEAALKHADAARETSEKRLDARTRAGVEASAALETARRDREGARSRLSAAQASREEAAEALRAFAAEETVDLTAAAQAADAARDRAESAARAVDIAEQAVETARAGADAARETRNHAQAERAALAREAESLRRLLEGGGDHDGVIDQLVAAPGFEAALAAAMGDDLDASLDAGALRCWRGGGVDAGALPEGATPLHQHVDAPDALTARLCAIGVVEADRLDIAARALKPGQRLVTREGALRRWDGLASDAGAPNAAAVRLETRNRLAEIDAAEAEAEAAAVAAETRETQTRDALAAAQTQAQAARETLKSLEAEARDLEQALAEARTAAARRDARSAALDGDLARAEAAHAAAAAELSAAEKAYESAELAQPDPSALATAQTEAQRARAAAADARAALESVRREIRGRAHRLQALESELADWARRGDAARVRIDRLDQDAAEARKALDFVSALPEELEAKRSGLIDRLGEAESAARLARDRASEAQSAARETDQALRACEREAAAAREVRAAAAATLAGARERLTDTIERIEDATGETPEALAARAEASEFAALSAAEIERRLDEARLARERLGAVNLRADEEAGELRAERERLNAERDELLEAVARLRKAVDTLSREGRARLLEAFEAIDGHFRTLFQTLFDGGRAELHLTESDDPLEAGLEILACPPGKKLETMSLMSGGEQALTATALIFAVFLSNPAPVCVLDEVDAPLDDANVDRYCRMLDEIRRLTETRFLVITHNPVTMARMDRLFGVTMGEQGVSQLVSVDLQRAERLVAAA